MKNVNVGFHQKIQLVGGFCLKRGAWTACRCKRRSLARKRGLLFWTGVVDTPMHTMNE